MDANHSIYKTPFSTTILLKISFVKYYSESQSEHEVKNINRKESNREEMRMLKNENIEMKAQIKELQNMVEEQKLVIAENSKKEFTEKETREGKAAEFQAEI